MFVASLEFAGEHAGRTCARESARELLMSRATAGRGIETQAPTMSASSHSEEVVRRERN